MYMKDRDMCMKDRDQHKSTSTSLNLRFCDFREMPLCHTMQGRGAQIPDWVVLPSSLRMYGPRGRQELEDLNAAGSEDEDEEHGEESMEGAGVLEEDVEIADEDSDGRLAVVAIWA